MNLKNLSPILFIGLNACGSLSTTVSSVGGRVSQTGTTSDTDLPVLTQAYVEYSDAGTQKPDVVGSDPARSSCSVADNSVPKSLLSIDADSGWTAVDPNAVPTGATAVFASAEAGANDSFAGTLPSQPVRSLARVRARMVAIEESGKVPWVFFKRGSSWSTNAGELSQLPLANSTAAVPVVLGSYGAASYYPGASNDAAHPAGLERRPHFYASGGGTQIGANAPAAAGQWIAIVGLEIDGGYQNDAATGPQNGLYFQRINGLLVEDSYIWGNRVNNINLDNRPYPTQTIKLVRVRRSVIGENNNVDPAALFSGQGIYVDNVYRMTVEQTVFDHTGWSSKSDGTSIAKTRNMFRHALYGQGPNAPSGKAYGTTPAAGGVCHMLVRASIFSNMVDGVDLKDGGDSINNLMFRTGIGMDYGYRSVGNIRYNTILEGADMNLGATPGNEGAQSGMGVYLDLSQYTDSDGKQISIEDNIIAKNGSSYEYRRAGLLQFADQNMVYDWKPADDNVSNGEVGKYFSKSSALESYMAAKSLSGSADDFIREARKISKIPKNATLFQNYSADAVNGYFRRAFGVAEPAANRK